MADESTGLSHDHDRPCPRPHGCSPCGDYGYADSNARATFVMSCLPPKHAATFERGTAVSSVDTAHWSRIRGHEMRGACSKP